MKNIIAILLTLSLLFVGCNGKDTTKNDEKTKNETTEKESNLLVCSGSREGTSLEMTNTYEFDEDDKVISSKEEMKIFYTDEDHKESLINSFEELEQLDDSSGVTSSLEALDDYIIYTVEIDYSIFNPEDIGMKHPYKDDAIEEAKLFDLECR